jgi:hypothetical protein
MIWWFLLYYPIIFAIIFIGKRVETRYPLNSIERNRADMALGCAFMSLPSMPLIVGVGYLAKYAFISIFEIRITHPDSPTPSGCPA